jgi:N4-gp56 family major capsid protein
MSQNLLAYWMAKKMDDSLWAAARQTGSVGFEAATINAIFGGDATTVDNLDASDTFSVAVIRKAATKLIALDATKIRTPDMPAGEGYFICFIHPYQAYSLKGDSEWVNRYQYAGPKYPDNPLFTGALGEVDGVILLESTQCSTSWNANSPSIRTAQAIMLAAECLARGQEESIVWSEQIDDYEFEHGIGIRAAWEDQILSQEAIVQIYTAAVDPSA